MTNDDIVIDYIFGLFLNNFPTDNIGPRVAYCPPNKTVRATKMAEKVKWTSPIFVDNSNAKIVPHCNRKSGTVFYWGVWTIHCRGYDDNPDNQPAVCTFNITVERKL